MASSRASSGYKTTQDRPATGASSHTSETTGLLSSNDGTWYFEVRSVNFETCWEVTWPRRVQVAIAASRKPAPLQVPLSKRHKLPSCYMPIEALHGLVDKGRNLTSDYYDNDRIDVTVGCKGNYLLLFLLRTTTTNEQVRGI